MIIEISVAIVALAFVALVVYVIVIINAMCGTLNQVDQIIAEVRKQLEETGGQAKKMIEHTNQVSFDLKRKMESLTSLFSAVSNVGDILETKTEALKKEALPPQRRENRFSHSDAQAQSADRELRTDEEGYIADLCELLGAGLSLWRRIKNKQPSGSGKK